MVTFGVGSPSIDFTVHDRILSSTSEGRLFRDVLDDRYILELPEDDPEAFQYLILWFYRIAHIRNEHDKRDFFSTIQYSTSLKLYALASKFQMELLQDAIITEFWCQYDNLIPWSQMGLTQDAIAYYEFNTKADCLLDKLLVDWMVDDTLLSQTKRPLGRLAMIDSSELDTSAFDLMPTRLIRAAFVLTNRVCIANACLMRKSSRGSSSVECKGKLCCYHVHGERGPGTCPAPEYHCLKRAGM